MKVSGIIIRQQWPWSFEAGIRWVLSSVLTVLLVTAAWYLIAEEGDLEAQVPLLAGGVIATMIGGYGHVSMVARGRRLVGQRRARLLDDSLQLLGDRAAVVAPAGTADMVTAFEAVDGLAHYHRPDCLMLAGRGIATLLVGTAADHRHDGRVPCGICRPDEGTHRSEDVRTEVHA